MTRQRADDPMNAGAPSSPFFPMAAVLMLVLNLVLGGLSGWFHSPMQGTPWQATGYVVAYALIGALVIPSLLVWVLRLVRGPMDRRSALKVFFFVSVALFPLLVVSVTDGVVDRLHINSAAGSEDVSRRCTVEPVELGLG